MVDFSKLQKISNLARELMKHGQASSMEQAMKMASEQIESGNVPEYVSAEPAQSKESETIEVQEEVSMPEIDDDTDHMELFKKLEEIVSRQQSTIAKLSTIANVHTNQLSDLTEMSGRFNSLVNDLTQLKEKVQKLEESPVMPKKKEGGQTTFKPTTPPAQQAPESAEQSAPAQPKGDGHARSGNYQSDDVSIEKFFYYGGK